MQLRPFYTALLLAFCSILCCTPPRSPAQSPSPTHSKRQPPKPAIEQAPGAGPDKVWLNDATRVYHCPGDRYYGRTKKGRYTTETEAKTSGAHGARGETCFR